MPVKDPRYYVWHNMVSRCHKPTHAAFGWYGARGIVVCEEWRRNFQAFVADMGERPPGFTLDRIDCDGPYSPENCRWVSQTVNQQNRTNNKLTKEVAEQIRAAVMAGHRNKSAVARAFGISPAMVRRIVAGKAWV